MEEELLRLHASIDKPILATCQIEVVDGKISTNYRIYVGEIGQRGVGKTIEEAIANLGFSSL